MSRSLVGSSSSSTLGSSSSSRSSWKRRRSPPDRSPIRAVSRSPVKPNRSSIEVAVISPSAVLVTRRIDSTVGSTRPSGSSSSSCWVRCCSATVRPCLTLPAVGRERRRRAGEHRGLAGAVDADDADPVARAEPPGRVRAAAAARRATRSTSSMSMTSLPSRWVANLCSSSRSRGGGTSSISALAASMRNFGFEVRAGGPRRSQASSLRTRFCRRVSEADGLPLPLGLGQHERGVAALVGVDDAVVHLPRPLADRVEEPPVVGDDHQRGRRAATRCSASQATASTSRWLVGSSSTIRSWSPSSSAASEQRRRSPPDSPTTARSSVTPASSSSTTSRHAGVGGPLVVGPAAEHRLADGVGVDELVALVEVADRAARAAARPARCRAPRGRSSPRAGWSCRRRCGRRCRSARPRRCRARRR